jgi:hypothetical protein
MDLSGITREQKLFGAAIANVVFIIMMFFDWAGPIARQDFDDWWIFLIAAVLGAGIFAAEAARVELPPIASIGAATYLTSILLWETVTFLFFADEHAFGFWIALVASIVGTVLAVAIWREER